jgi:hypothetical protein
VRLLIQLRTKGVAKESPPVCVLCSYAVENVYSWVIVISACVLHERRAETMNSGGVSVVTLCLLKAA